MAVEVVAGSPLAEVLQNAVQQKLMELGWSSGGFDDSALAEYVILMLAGGKNEQELATELSSDLLGPEDTGAPEFASWLFKQAELFSNQQSGAQAQDSTPQQLEQSSAKHDPMNEDAEMNDNEESADGSIPTGPKSMHTARNPKLRDKRMLGQMNKALDRSNDASLHRIKGAAGGGVGRINSHARDPPKGPAPKGPRATMNRLANAPTPQRQMNAMNQMGANNPNSPFGNITPQQQMQLMAMYEQQAKMMAQIFNPQQQQQTGGPQKAFGPTAKGRNPLFDRIENKSKQNNGFNKGLSQRGAQNAGVDIDPTSSMDVEPSSQNAPSPDTTMCRFNLTCSKPDCHFAHQSPVAPPGVVIDMTDTCSFGVACKNRKCTGKHPSPAKLGVQECIYYPNCTNRACPYKHPDMPPCRNGADCSVANCKFSHVKVMCKFDPCLNASCPYKHNEGQKRGSYNDKVWVNPAGEEKQHVSDRKFVDEAVGEELVVPVKAEEGGQPEGIVT